MVEKNLEISLLLDFYGEILTEKQQEVVDLYYNEDFSLAEIAEKSKITRQGVRDSIKRGEATLFEMESKLGLAKKFSEMKSSLDEISNAAELIEDINKRYCFSRDIGVLAKKIKDCTQALCE